MRKLTIILGSAGFLFGLQAFAHSAQILCRLTPSANPVSVAQSYGLTLLDRSVIGEFYVMRAPASANIHLIESQMSTNPLVLWAEDDQSLSMPEGVGGGKGGTTAVINDRAKAYALNAQAFNQVGFNAAWSSGSGRSVRIGVLDTGLSPNCGFLWTKVYAQLNAVEGYGMAYDIARNTDSNANGKLDEGVGHGTFVAGILDQMSPLSKLVVVRVADSDGNSTSWRLIKGIAFAVSKGAEIINVSLGSAQNISALTEVLDWTDDKGVLLVAPAGNDNKRMVLNPAGISKVLAVAGVDAFDRKAPFSNFEGKIESSAPATGVLSYGTAGKLVKWSGTSFAAPFLAGGLAECLRHMATKVDSGKLLQAAEKSGTNINTKNLAYKDMLGTRLWMPSLWNEVRKLIVP